jgi:hypothetical protein
VRDQRVERALLLAPRLLRPVHRALDGCGQGSTAVACYDGGVFRWPAHLSLAVLGLAGCGGRTDLDLIDQQRDASAVDAREEAPASASDADVASDTWDEIDCAPTAGDPTGGCSGKAFCVAWIFADGSAPTGQYPDGVVRSACETGQVDEVCDGKPPIQVGYATYANKVAWAECAEP